MATLSVAPNKRQLAKNKINMCLCGRVAVGPKRPGGFWSCARCTELDAIVALLHDKAERRRSEDILRMA